MENNRKRAHRESLTTRSVHLLSIKLEETKVMKKNEHTYQDCIEHLNKCRNKIRVYTKKRLKERGVSELLLFCSLNIPNVRPLRDISIEDSFYDFISGVSNNILENINLLCNIYEINHLKNELRRVKVENTKLKRKNAKQAIRYLKQKGVTIRLRHKNS